MTTNFRRWETDPFFAAAEDVQDSADRLDSAYRTWIYLKGLIDDPEAASSIDSRRRELKTALGTAKWQLEEFERAVLEASLTEQVFIAKDTSARHKQFVEAIRHQISSVENDLRDLEERGDVTVLPAVSLGDQDKHDLALFLSGGRPAENSVTKVGLGESTLDRDASTSVFDEETKEEDPSTSSGSRDSKVCASSMHIPPVWSMDRICNIDELGNHISHSFSKNMVRENQNLKSVCSYAQKPLGKLESEFLDIRTETENYSIMQQFSDDKYVKGEDKCRVNPLGLVNGHAKSASVGNNMDTWSFVKTTRDKLSDFLRTEGRVNGLTSWAFCKKKQLTELKVSRSGFKRWKDGDINSKYYKRLSGYFSFNVRPRDVEMGLSNNCFWRNINLLRGGVWGSVSNSEENVSWTEVFQNGLQRTQLAFQSPRTVQLASAMLVTLGIIGCSALVFSLEPPTILRRKDGVLRPLAMVICLIDLLLITIQRVMSSFRVKFRPSQVGFGSKMWSRSNYSCDQVFSGAK